MSQTITVNTTEYEIIRSRETLLGSALDTKRPDAWMIYGYPGEVPFSKMLSAYSRGGAGHGAVHRLLDGCWQSKPRIKSPASDKETPWEAKVNKLLTSIRAFAKLRDFDRRNMVGRYSALIYRVGDGKTLRDPLEKAQKLVDVVPVYEDQIKVTDWNNDEASEDYGKPTMYQYRTRPVQGMDTQGRPETWRDVHPSRVQIMAEGSVGDMFDGVPLLLPGYNALVDIEKISGGSAESYLKNSARAITFEYLPDAQPSTIGEDGAKISVKQAHEDQVRKLNRNIDSAIVTQGAKAGVLQTHTSDPTGAFQLAANLFSSSVQIPFVVLFGQQTGRLASDQDRKDMEKRCKSRQLNELTPMLEEFIKRMQAAGIVEQGEFEVEFPDIATPSEKEKLDNAKVMAAINTEVFKAGGGNELPFKGDEIRKAGGYEQQSGVDVLDLPAEGDPLAP